MLEDHAVGPDTPYIVYNPIEIIHLNGTHTLIKTEVFRCVFMLNGRGENWAVVNHNPMILKNKHNTIQKCNGYCAHIIKFVCPFIGTSHDPASCCMHIFEILPLRSVGAYNPNNFLYYADCGGNVGMAVKKQTGGRTKAALKMLGTDYCNHNQTGRYLID